MGRVQLSGATPGYYGQIRGSQFVYDLLMRVNCDSLPGRDLFTNPNFLGKFVRGESKETSPFSRVPTDSTRGQMSAFFDKQPVYMSRSIGSGPVNPEQTQSRSPVFDKIVSARRFTVRY